MRHISILHSESKRCPRKRLLARYQILGSSLGSCLHRSRSAPPETSPTVEIHVPPQGRLPLRLLARLSIQPGQCVSSGSSQRARTSIDLAFFLSVMTTLVECLTLKLWGASAIARSVPHERFVSSHVEFTMRCLF